MASFPNSTSHKKQNDGDTDHVIVVYKRVPNISHGMKIFYEDYYVKRDRWTSSICQNGIVKDVPGTIMVIQKFAEKLINQEKYDLAFPFWIDALNTIVSPSGLFLAGQDAEYILKLTKLQMKKIKSYIQNCQFASKSLVVAGVFLNMIESAQRKKKFARAKELLDATLKRIEFMEPSEFTAWLWQIKGVQEWSTLEISAFCPDASQAFLTIFDCFKRCRSQLITGVETKGQFVQHEATLALSSMIRACLMMPLDLENMGRLKRYVDTYMPCEDQLSLALCGLEQFERESRSIGPTSNYYKIYWVHQIDLQLYIFIYHIRRAQLLQHQNDTHNAVALLKIWLDNVYKSQLLYIYGLQDILKEIIDHYIHKYTKVKKIRSSENQGRHHPKQNEHSDHGGSTEDNQLDQLGIVPRQNVAEMDRESDTSSKDTCGESNLMDIRVEVYSKDNFHQIDAVHGHIEQTLSYTDTSVKSGPMDNRIEVYSKDHVRETDSIHNHAEQTSKECTTDVISMDTNIKPMIPGTGTWNKDECFQKCKQQKSYNLDAKESVSEEHDKTDCTRTYTDSYLGSLGKLGDEGPSSDSDVYMDALDVVETA